MNDQEKAEWLAVLSFIFCFGWATSTCMFLGAVFNPDTPPAVGLLLIPLAVLVGYLLILSWRLAYLSGRKNSR